MSVQTGKTANNKPIYFKCLPACFLNWTYSNPLNDYGIRRTKSKKQILRTCLAYTCIFIKKKNIGDTNRWWFGHTCIDKCCNLFFLKGQTYAWFRRCTGLGKDFILTVLKKGWRKFVENRHFCAMNVAVDTALSRDRTAVLNVSTLAKHFIFQ